MYNLFNLFLFSAFYASITYTKELFIFSINDFHGRLEHTNNDIGAARYLTALDEYKSLLGASEENSIVVAAGDLYQGGFLSNIGYGDVTSKFLKELNITVSAVGNHEFDWGREHFDRWQNDGGFDFIAANIFKKSGESLFEPYKIMYLAGYKIAFIGLTTLETLYTSSPKHVNDLHFMDVDIAAMSIIDKLNIDEKPDFIIALTHIASYQNLSTGMIYGNELLKLNKIQEIDAIITGHSHQNVAGFSDNGKKAVVQACSYGDCIGLLKIDTETKMITPLVNNLVEKIHKIKQDHKFSEILQINKEFYAQKVDISIGYAAKELNQKDIAEFIAHRTFKMYENSGVDIVILNQGLFRTEISKGDIKLKHTYELTPFDNSLLFATVSGEILSRVLSHGLKMQAAKQAVFYGEFDSCIMKFHDIDFRCIIKDAEYNVIVSDFLFNGGDLYDFSGGEYSAESNFARIEHSDESLLIRSVITEIIKREIFIINDDLCFF